MGGRSTYGLEHHIGEALVPSQCPTQQGREDYGLSSTERPHGASAAENALCACQATTTVPHACTGKEVATRSYQDAWAEPNGVEPPFCSLSAVMVLRPPQDTPTQAGQGATDARKAPSARVRLRTSKPGRELRAKCTVSL